MKETSQWFKLRKLQKTEWILLKPRAYFTSRFCCSLCLAMQVQVSTIHKACKAVELNLVLKGVPFLWSHQIFIWLTANRQKKKSFPQRIWYPTGQTANTYVYKSFAYYIHKVYSLYSVLVEHLAKKKRDGIYLRLRIISILCVCNIFSGLKFLLNLLFSVVI